MDAWESRPRSFSSQRQGGAQYSEGVVYSEHQVLGDGHELLHDPMAEDGFAFSGGIRGIYSALDLEVAFRNARKIQHDGKWFKVVVQNLATCDRGANAIILIILNQ